MRLPKELEDKIIGMPGTTVNGKPVQAEESRKAREKPELREPEYYERNCFVVPLHVVAGDNARGQKARIGRAGHERRVCASVFAGAHSVWGAACCALTRDRPLTVYLARVGGRKMDDDNLPASLKYIRDTVALFLGRDDNDPLIHWEYAQEPGGPSGVRVRLSVEDHHGPATDATHATPP